MSDRRGPVFVMTDFGAASWYVGAVRGEIAQRAPHIPIHDLAHDLPPGRVRSAAFVLGVAMASLPRPSMLCCVIDPGVGSDRRAMCGRIGPWWFVGPDNGLATPLLTRAHDDFALYEITEPDFRGGQTSHTFHGRDVFGPATGRLAVGADPSEAGDLIEEPVLIPTPDYRSADPAEPEIMLIDRFGNLVTDLPRAVMGDGAEAVVRAGELTVSGLATTFSDVADGEALAYWGSAGTLEFAINGGSAAETTGLSVGDTITVGQK